MILFASIFFGAQYARHAVEFVQVYSNYVLVVLICIAAVVAQQRHWNLQRQQQYKPYNIIIVFGTQAYLEVFLFNICLPHQAQEASPPSIPCKFSNLTLAIPDLEIRNPQACPEYKEYQPCWLARLHAHLQAAETAAFDIEVVCCNWPKSQKSWNDRSLNTCCDDYLFLV